MTCIANNVKHDVRWWYAAVWYATSNQHIICFRGSTSIWISKFVSLLMCSMKSEALWNWYFICFCTSIWMSWFVSQMMCRMKSEALWYQFTCFCVSMWYLSAQLYELVTRLHCIPKQKYWETWHLRRFYVATLFSTVNTCKEITEEALCRKITLYLLIREHHLVT